MSPPCHVLLPQQQHSAAACATEHCTDCTTYLLPDQYENPTEQRFGIDSNASLLAPPTPTPVRPRLLLARKKDWAALAFHVLKTTHFFNAALLDKDQGNTAALPSRCGSFLPTSSQHTHTCAKRSKQGSERGGACGPSGDVIDEARHAVRRAFSLSIPSYLLSKTVWTRHALKIAAAHLDRAVTVRAPLSHLVTLLRPIVSRTPPPTCISNGALTHPFCVITSPSSR